MSDEKKITTITGTIPYTITIDEKGEWSIQYLSELENDIAAMFISKYVLETAIKGFEKEKSSKAGKHKQSAKVMLQKAIATRFGMDMVCRYMTGSYKIWKEHEAKLLAEAEEIRKERDGGEAKIVKL